MALMTVEDLERDSQISRHTWRRWLAEGRLAAVRLGRRVRVDEADYRAFVNQGRAGAVPPESDPSAA